MLLARLGDPDGYLQLRRSSLDKLKDSDELLARERICLGALALPPAPDSTAEPLLLEAARSEFKSQTGALTRALAEYRSGNWADALKALERASHHVARRALGERVVVVAAMPLI